MSARVINGPDGPEIRLPLYPRKRTQVGHLAMSVSCHNRKSRSTFLIEVGLEQVTSLVRADINHGGASLGQGAELNARLTLLHV